MLIISSAAAAFLLSAVGSVCVRLASIYFDCFATFFALLSLFVDLGHEVLEKLGNADIMFRTRLEVLHLVLGGHVTRFVRLHSAVVQVDLVSDHDFANVGVRVLIDTFHPLAHVLERLFIRDVEGHHHAIRLFVKSMSQSPKALLARSVPQLGLDCRSILHGHILGRKLYPDSGTYGFG